MPDIICKECDAVISDPCIKLEGLYSIRADLFKQLKMTPNSKKINDQIDEVESMMNTHLGVGKEHLENKTRKVDSPTQFILTCFRGHTNQYFITCQP